MKKLVRIKRPGNRAMEFYAEGFRRHPTGLNPTQPAVNSDNPFIGMVAFDFYEIDDRDVEAFLQEAARSNPGCDVELYDLSKVGHCPAGDFVLKVVSADGILPG